MRDRELWRVREQAVSWLVRSSARAIRPPEAPASRRGTTRAHEPTNPPTDSIVFLRPLHPDEPLQIDHVLRAQVAHVAADGAREIEQALIGPPVRLRSVVEVESVRLRGDAGDVRLE